MIAPTLAGLLACASPERSCEVRGATAALLGGADRAEYLKLSGLHERAVVSIQAGGAAGGSCSGLLIAERTVLTAAHCSADLSVSSFEVAFFGEEREPLFTTTASVAATHPSADVMLLTLAESPRAGFEVWPVAPAERLPRGLAVDSLVQIAGFGYDAQRSLGQRAFLVETVESIDAAELVVNANALGGACFGDSGGPLLVRSDTGEIQVLAVLSAGSANCVGSDVYTRVDTLREWLAPLSEHSGGGRDVGSETLGSEGRCFDDRAVWSESGKARAEVCVGGQVCGWDERVEGYRCVAPERDACAGVSDLGTCEGGNAVRCVRGERQEEPCVACGFTCERSARSGQAVCMSLR